ncbi:MAG: tetratricopeptide repeat protein, partial [Armatimonadota bacterium]|nr:tetratricopeptide repeat protein [Armatimonadota bacterium]
KDPTIKRHANLLHHLLDLQRQIGDEAWRATAREYIAAMSKSGAAPGAFAKLEIVYYYEHNIKEAIELSTKFLEKYPTHGLAAEASFIKGDCLRLSGDKKTALSVFDALISVYSESSGARFYVNAAVRQSADILAESGRVKEAIKRLNRIVATNPTAQALKLDHIGRLYAGAEDWKEAARAFQREARIHGASIDTVCQALYNAGDCYYRMGDTASARGCLLRIIDRAPDSSWCRKARGTLFVWDEMTGGPDPT